MIEGIWLKILLWAWAILLGAFVAMTGREYFVAPILRIVDKCKEMRWPAVLFNVAFCSMLISAAIEAGATKTNGVMNLPPQTMAMQHPAFEQMQAPVGDRPRMLMSGGLLERTISDEEIALGYSCVLETNDVAYSYAMPSNAQIVGNWHMRGTFGEWMPVSLGWGFPLGTNSYSAVSVFSDGKIRPRPRDVEHQISAVGVPMLFTQGLSKFWTYDCDDGSALLSWDNAFLNGDTNAPVNAQIRLCRNGDFTTRSNELLRVYSRVNPDDWDGDGIINAADLNPMSFDGDFFGPMNILPEGANSNAYCTVSVVATGPDALITFLGDGPSDYADPVFVAKSGETNEVVILIGKTYTISSEWPFDVVGASDPETEIWQMRSAEHQTHVRRPVTISSSEGNPFTMSVLPTNLGGTFVWNQPDCGCTLTGSGDTFGWNCSTSCTCCGTYADGWYSYEGYLLPAVGCLCGCWSDGTPEWSHSPTPLAASVSASFSKSAVIFEDDYENEPGQWASGSPTRTRLNIIACGGPNGGVLSVTSTNITKLTRVSGPDLPLAPVAVPSGSQVMYSIVYEGREASGVADDINVTAVLADEDTGDAQTNDCAVTSVRLELQAVWEAPENPCTNRHVYGVGERVKLRTFPENIETSFALTRIDNDELSIYDNMISNDIYACPVFSATPNLKVLCREAEYRPTMAIVEPEEIVSPDAFWDSDYAPCLPLGSVGGTLLAITNYVGPMNVSFHGIMVSEIPCVHTNMPSGFFATANYTGQWTHKYIFDYGWAMATRISSNNYWTVDRAGHPGTYDNWSAGRLVWDIPIGWVRMRFDGDNRHGVDVVEHVGYTNTTTRALLIGGSQDVYQQIFSISADGSASIEKHGHTMSRGRFCRIKVDERTVQWTHGL